MFPSPSRHKLPWNKRAIIILIPWLYTEYTLRAWLLSIVCVLSERGRAVWKRQASSLVRTVFWIERHCLRLLSSRSAARTTNTPNKCGDGGKSLSLRAGDKTACLCCGFITPQPIQWREFQRSINRGVVHFTHSYHTRTHVCHFVENGKRGWKLERKTGRTMVFGGPLWLLWKNEGGRNPNKRRKMARPSPRLSLFDSDRESESPMREAG